MKTRSAESGFSSLSVLVLLLFCAAATAGAAVVIDATLLRERTSRSTWDERKALSAEVERVIALLAADPTPESDSPVDPVWGDLGAVGLPGAA
ncbi:MAG TPA: hypothetical protein VHE79_04875, partial [Spirochaetia bacterium]